MNPDSAGPSIELGIEFPLVFMRHGWSRGCTRHLRRPLWLSRIAVSHRWIATDSARLPARAVAPHTRRAPPTNGRARKRRRPDARVVWRAQTTRRDRSARLDERRALKPFRGRSSRRLDQPGRTAVIVGELDRSRDRLAFAVERSFALLSHPHCPAIADRRAAQRVDHRDLIDHDVVPGIRRHACQNAKATAPIRHTSDAALFQRSASPMYRYAKPVKTTSVIASWMILSW